MRFLSDVLPSSTGAINLGSSALRWGGIFGTTLDISSVATATYFRATSTLSAAGITEVIGLSRDTLLGDTPEVWKIASMLLDNDTANLTAVALDMECEDWNGPGGYPGKVHFDIKLSSRGSPVGSGPKVVFNVRGTHIPTHVGVKVYRVSTSGPYNIYAYLTGGNYSGFNVRVRTYGAGFKATLYENPTNEQPTPAGTLVWDSATAPRDSEIIGLTPATAVMTVGGLKSAGVTGNGTVNRIPKWLSSGSPELTTTSNLEDTGTVVNSYMPLSVTGAINATSHITAAGYLRSITTGHAGITLSGNVPNFAFIDFMRELASKYRWRLYMNEKPENADGLDTGNAGSDLSLIRYGATSTLLGYVFLINRSNGFMRLGNNVTPATVQLDVTGAIGASLGVTALGLVTGAGLKDTTLLSKTFIGTDSTGRLEERVVTPGTIGAVSGSGTYPSLARWKSGFPTTLENCGVSDDGVSIATSRILSVNSLHKVIGFAKWKASATVNQQHWKIATMQPSASVGQGAQLEIDFVGGYYTANLKNRLHLQLGNRDAFAGYFQIFGPTRQPYAGIKVYREADNSYSVYAYMAASQYACFACDYRKGDYADIGTVLFADPVDVSSPGGADPTGTLVLDTTVDTPVAPQFSAIGTVATVGGLNLPTGLGTLNYLARWTGSGTTLGIGTTQDNGSSVFMGIASAIGGTVSPTLRVDQYASRAAYAAITYGLNVNNTDDDTLPVATQRYIAAFNYTKSGSAANTGQSLGISQYSTISNGSDGSHTGFYQTTNISPGAALTGTIRQFYADRNYTSYTTGTRGSVVTRYGFFSNDFNAGGHLTVTNNVVFFAAEQSSCTNTYGYQSQISAGTQKWGLYFSGTAQNYLAGNLGLGISVATEKLDVVGNAKVSGLITSAGLKDTTLLSKPYIGTDATGRLVPSSLVGGTGSPTALGTADYLPRFSLGGATLEDSGVMDDDNALTVNRRLFTKSPSLASGVGNSASQCEWYTHSQNTTPSRWYKIASFLPVNTYGTGGSKVIFEVHCGQYNSTQRTTYHVEMGDRLAGGNPMRYYVHAEGANRDIGSGIQVYSEVNAPSAPAKAYHVYLYTLNPYFTGTFVTAKNTGYNRSEVTFYPNPVLFEATNPYNLERPPGTLDFDTATCQLNWSSIGYFNGVEGGGATLSSLFNVTGHITASESLNVTASTGSLLRVGPSFIGTGLSWIAQGIRIKGDVILHDASVPANYCNFTPATASGITLAFVGLAAAFNVPGTVKGAGLIDTTLISQPLLGTGPTGQLVGKTLATAGIIGGSGTAGTIPLFLTGGITIGDSFLTQGSGFLKYASNNSNALLQLESTAGGAPVVAFAKGAAAGNLYWALASPDNDFYLRRYADGTNPTMVFKADRSTGVVDFNEIPTVDGIPIITMVPPFTTGTADFLPRWGANGKTLQDSLVKDDGTSINLGRNSSVTGQLVAQWLVSRAVAAAPAQVDLESDAAQPSTIRFRARRPTLYDSWIIGRDGSNKYFVNYYTTLGVYDWQPLLFDGAAKSVNLRGAVTLDSQLLGTSIDMSGDIHATNLRADVSVFAAYRVEAPSVICGTSIFGTEGFKWTGAASTGSTNAIISANSSGTFQIACSSAANGGLSVGLQGVAVPTAANSVSLVYQDTDAAAGTVPYTAWLNQNSIRTLGVNINGDLLMSRAGNTGGGLDAALAAGATGGFFWINAIAAVPVGAPSPVRQTAGPTPGAVPLVYCNLDDSLYARRNGTWNKLGLPANNLTGTGASPFSARWTGANTLASGALQDNGSTIAMGTAPVSTYLFRLFGTYSTPGVANTANANIALEVRTVRTTEDATTKVSAVYGVYTTTQMAYSGSVGIYGLYDFMSNPNFTGAAPTTAAFGYYSSLTISAASVVSTRFSFAAAATITSNGGSLVSEHGFHCYNLSAGTSRYGFRGQLDAGGGQRWNLYMDGGAPNYLAGSLGIGKNGPTVELDVVGSARLTDILYITKPTGIAPIQVASTTLCPNLNVEIHNGYTEPALTANLRAGYTTSGGGNLTSKVIPASPTTSDPVYIKWSARILPISNGDGGHFSTAGYYSISQPTTVNGTLSIPIVGGSATPPCIVTTDGIPLIPGYYDALYVILPIGGSQSVLESEFRIVRYPATADFIVPPNWFKIAWVIGDTLHMVTWFNGVRLTANQTFNSVLGDLSGAGTANTLTMFATPTTLGNSRLTQGASGDSLAFGSANTNSLLTLDTTGAGGTVSYAISKAASLLWSLSSLGDSSFSLRRWLSGTPTDVFKVEFANGGVIANYRNTYFIGEAGTNSEVFINSEQGKAGYLNFSRTGLGTYWGLRHETAAVGVLASPLILSRGLVETWRIGTDGVMVFANTPKVGATDVSLVGHTHSYLEDILETDTNSASTGSRFNSFWYSGSAANVPSANAGVGLRVNRYTGGVVSYTGSFQLLSEATSALDLYWKKVTDGVNNTWSSWFKIWHAGNDGALSGLDADLLDGQEPSYYINGTVGTVPLFTTSANRIANSVLSQGAGTLDFKSVNPSALFSIVSNSGGTSALAYTKGTTLEWALTAANNGLFYLRRYPGGTETKVLSASQSTGVVDFAVAPTINGNPFPSTSGAPFYYRGKLTGLSLGTTIAANTRGTATLAFAPGGYTLQDGDTILLSPSTTGGNTTLGASSLVALTAKYASASTFQVQLWNVTGASISGTTLIDLFITVIRATSSLIFFRSKVSVTNAYSDSWPNDSFNTINLDPATLGALGYTPSTDDTVLVSPVAAANLLSDEMTISAGTFHVLSATSNYGDNGYVHVALWNTSGAAITTTGKKMALMISVIRSTS